MLAKSQWYLIYLFFLSLRVLGILPSTVILLCVSHLNVLPSEDQPSKVDYLNTTLDEGTEAWINNFLIVRPTLSGRVGVRFELQLWPPKPLFFPFTAWSEKGSRKVLEVRFQEDWVAKQKKPRINRSKIAFRFLKTKS